MAELSKTLEEIAYLKLWLGILLVTTISLGGWIMTHAARTSSFLVLASIGGFLISAVTCFLLHTRIVQEIARVE